MDNIQVNNESQEQNGSERNAAYGQLLYQCLLEVLFSIATNIVS